MEWKRRYRLEEGGRLDFPEWVANPIRHGKFLEAKFMSLDSFDHLTYLNHTSSSHVLLGRDKENRKYYVLKGIRKTWMYRAKKYFHVRRQLEVHAPLSNRFIANFFRVFDHHSFVYVVQEYCLGGTLAIALQQRKGRFKEATMSVEAAKFYLAEITSALEYLHTTRNIIYRNLHIENVGLSWNGHVKLLGFGKAVEVEPDDPWDETTDDDFGGRVESCAPELLRPSLIEPFTKQMDLERIFANPSLDEENKDEEEEEEEEGEKVRFHSFQVDWFSLGALVHRLVLGYHPFGDSTLEDESDIVKAMLKGKRVTRVWTPVFERRNKKNGILELMDGLLDTNIESRWGYQQVKNSEMLTEIDDWGLLHTLKPPLVPKYAFVEADSSCFKHTQMMYKKEMKPGVYPEELRSRPTESELAYCYYTDVCKEVMTEAYRNHTVKFRQLADEAVSKRPTLNFMERDSDMLKKLANGMQKRQERMRNRQILLKQHENEQ